MNTQEALITLISSNNLLLYVDRYTGDRYEKKQKHKKEQFQQMSENNCNPYIILRSMETTLGSVTFRSSRYRTLYDILSKEPCCLTSHQFSSALLITLILSPALQHTIRNLPVDTV